jgi:hypothetical protein
MTDGGARVRSPKYPYITLGRASEMATSMYRFAADTEVNLPALFNHWKLKPTSGNAKKTYAALKTYGLVTDSGSGDKRKAKLTGRAVKIVHGNALERAENLKLAALTPKIYRYCWEQWGTKFPSDEFVKSHLITEKRFNENAVSSFWTDYKKTLTFAKLNQGGPTELPPVIDDDELDDNADDQGAEAGLRQERTQVIVRERIRRPGVRQDVFVLDEGEVVVQLPDKLSKESFADLEAWMGLVLRKARRTVADDGEGSAE